MAWSCKNTRQPGGPGRHIRIWTSETRVITDDYPNVAARRRPRVVQALPTVTVGNWPNGELRASSSLPLVNPGSQSNFSRSHEHATHRSTCIRHSNDAAIPAPYLTRLGAQTYAKAYVRPFEDRPPTIRSGQSGLPAMSGRSSLVRLTISSRAISVIGHNWLSDV